MTNTSAYIALLGIAASTLFLAQTTHAAEIQYATIEERFGDTAIVEYNSPLGDEFFTCNAHTGNCSSVGTTAPALLPSIDGDTGYDTSIDGTYGLRSETNGTTTAYMLYNVEAETPERIETLTFSDTPLDARFSRDSENIVFLFANELVRYSIEDGTTDSIATTFSEYPFKSVSPGGTYVASYNWSDGAHVIWNLTASTTQTIPDTSPDFVEFSQDETRAVFATEDNSVKTLFTIDLTQGTDTIEAKRLFSDDFTVNDYLFFDNALFFVANRDHPLRWKLYRHNFQKDETVEIEDDISYADYIWPLGDTLSFLHIEGKNTNVVVYDPRTEDIRTLSAVEPSPAAPIRRRVEKYGDTNVVLWSPIAPSHRELPLFVWLHGGPQRQTSIGYHPYLSYGVYDELLERIVQSGAYVMKIDYTGSFGYGTDFQDALDNNIGKVDVADVRTAIDALKEDREVGDRYLIGNSYGGYLSLRTLVEYPKTFTGAIGINGVYDWFTLIERIPSSPFAQRFSGTPDLEGSDTNLPTYLQASIVNRAENINDQNVLLVYGENDGTVPTWQTREFYYQLEGIDKNVSLLQLDGEEHVIRKRSSLDQLCSSIAATFEIDDITCN